MLIVYNKLNGRIATRLPDHADFHVFFREFPDEFTKDLASLHVDEDIDNLSDYHVVGSKLIKKSDQEINEIIEYDRILSLEERALIQLKPSHEEIAKAKNTIEILTLLQEVM